MRLIEQQHSRPLHQCAREQHASQLPVGQLAYRSRSQPDRCHLTQRVKRCSGTPLTMPARAIEPALAGLRSPCSSWIKLDLPLPLAPCTTQQSPRRICSVTSRRATTPSRHTDAWRSATSVAAAVRRPDLISELSREFGAQAVVLSVDEKPSIQALERAQGYLKLPNGRAMIDSARTDNAARVRD